MLNFFLFKYGVVDVCKKRYILNYIFLFDKRVLRG